MAIALTLHRVADYDAWRKVYDCAADMQKDGGATKESVHRMADDPDNVWSSMSLRVWRPPRRSLPEPTLRTPYNVEAFRAYRASNSSSKHGIPESMHPMEDQSVPVA
jgi:hypothetical protein